MSQPQVTSSFGAGLSDSDRRFLRAFERAKLAPADFHHRDHIRAAWAMLCTYSLERALVRFTEALRRLVTAAGKPELYHQTISWAYLLLIHERLHHGGAGLAFAEFALRNPDLLTWRPSVLDQYYPAAVLDSELARRVFLLPRCHGVL